MTPYLRVSSLPRDKTALGELYESHRALLAQDFWMSVGFVYSDFMCTETWKAALRRGPLQKNTTSMSTQTEENFCDEPLSVYSSPPATESLSDLFAYDENETDLTTEMPTDLDFDWPDDIDGGYIDSGTPTMHGVSYTDEDFSFDMDIGSLFDPPKQEVTVPKNDPPKQGVTVPQTDLGFLDMSSNNIRGVNLGEFMRSRKATRFIFK